MMFLLAKHLRERVQAGEITTSVRILDAAAGGRIGGRYPLLDGCIEVTRLQEVDLEDITEAMAREGGFESLGRPDGHGQARPGRAGVHRRFRIRAA